MLTTTLPLKMMTMRDVLARMQQSLYLLFPLKDRGTSCMFADI